MASPGELLNKEAGQREREENKVVCMDRKENSSDRGAEEEDTPSETVADGCYCCVPVSVLAILCVLTSSVLRATF